ncbi:MAG: hypothetical protein KJ069_29630 [Anaerolineae bacterium]|nr:hypothetical protein [Anaerolineae bacterium]
MVEALNHFFELNRPLVFFVYGQVFFVMGLAIALQSRHHSRLELARSLGWLAAFGLVHGLHEWGAVFIPIQAVYVDTAVIQLLEALHVILLALSFSFLLQFGVELLRNWQPRLVILPLLMTLLWAFIFVIPGLAWHGDFADWHQQASIWARYLLGFTGGVVAAVGLYYQAQRYIKPLNVPSIYRMLQVAGICLLTYAVLGGLIVPGGLFFPANWLNETAVPSALGVPVPVFRSIAGLVFAIAIIRALNVFDVEVDRLIEGMQIEQSLTMERERIGRELHDGALQEVYSAGLIVASARRKLAQEPALAEQRLERAIQAIDGAIASLRVYMGELRDAPTMHSLPEILQQQTADARLTALLDVELALDLPATAVFSPIQTHHIAAIVNEALSNAARHAQAHHVWIKGNIISERLCLTITDDGRGLDGQLSTDG